MTKKRRWSRLREWAKNKSEASKKKRLERQRADTLARKKRRKRWMQKPDFGRYGNSSKSQAIMQRKWKQNWAKNEAERGQGMLFNFSDKRKSRSRSKRTSRCRRVKSGPRKGRCYKSRSRSKRTSRCRRVKSGPRKGRCYKTRSRSKRTSRRRRISYERPRARSRSRRRCRRVKSGPRKGRCYKTRSRRRSRR